MHVEAILCGCQYIRTSFSPLQPRPSEASKNPDLQEHVKDPPLLMQFWAQLFVPSSHWLIAVILYMCGGGRGYDTAYSYPTEHNIVEYMHRRL